MSREKLGYSYILGGQHHHKRSAIDVIESELEGLFDSNEWYSLGNASLKSNQTLELEGPTADMGLSTGLVFGLIAYVGGWAGNKVLDELYEYKIKPALINLYCEVKSKAKSGHDFSFEYQNIVWYEDHKMLVVVRMKVKSEQEIDDSFDLINQAHKNAIKWIESNGKQAPIHEYTIENKILNVEPNFYSALKDIQRDERLKSIKKIGQVIEK